LAQIGAKAIKAKPLKGFGGAGVLEVVADHDGNTFRAIYTLRFAEAVFVLHAFQKKSKQGAATPKADIDLLKVGSRLQSTNTEGSLAAESRDEEAEYSQ
jgi:phage-related protein